MDTFFSDEDREVYLDLVAEGCAAAGTEVWAYCLMPNHVHLLVVPSHEDGLRAAFGEAHRRYTLWINQRQNCGGYLWQGRFQSYVMDGDYVLACAHFIERTPLRERLTRRTRDWAWSSARAHLNGEDDQLVSVQPLLDYVPDWGAFLRSKIDDDVTERLLSHARTGRPCGSIEWIEELEGITGRTLKKQKPGPKPGSTRAKPKKRKARAGKSAG